MLDISFAELLVIAVIALLVIGPQRLPETIRTLGLWLGRLRRALSHAKNELEREVGMDDIKRQLHNEEVMRNLKEFENEVAGHGGDNGSTKESDRPETDGESRS